MSPNVKRALEECIAYHDALRRLGYQSGDIFALVVTDGRSGKLAAFVMLRLPAQELNFTAWLFDNSAEGTEFYNAWPNFVRQWNGEAPGMTDTDRERIFNGSYVRSHAFDFVMLLEKKTGNISRGALSMLERYRQ